jgi:hypothetical protein
MVKRDLMEKLERIEYLLEYLSREIETIKRVLGIEGGIFTILEGGIETYKTATSEYKKIISFERMIRNIKGNTENPSLYRSNEYNTNNHGTKEEEGESFKTHSHRCRIVDIL